MSAAAPPPPVAALQRAAGSLAVTVRADGAGEPTRLGRLHQAGCLKLRFPRTVGGAREAVVVNTAGGLTGGDRLDADYAVGDGATLAVATQAAERVYRSSGGEATVSTRLRVGAGASLAFLPQETILFDGGRLRRRLHVDLAATSRFLLVESVVLGRTLMGETVRSGLFRDSWRVCRDGALVFAEEARLDGDIDAVRLAAAGLGGARAFATVLAQDERAEARLGPAREIVGDGGGASLADGLLVARLAADSGFALRRRLVPLLLALANGPLPRVWSL